MEITWLSLKNILIDFQKNVPFRLGTIAYQTFAGYSNIQLDIGIIIFRAFYLKIQIIDLSLLFMELTRQSLENILSDFQKNLPFFVQTPQPIKVLLDIQIYSWILELSCSSSKSRSQTYQFYLWNLLGYSLRIFSVIFRKTYHFVQATQPIKVLLDIQIFS